MTAIVSFLDQIIDGKDKDEYLLGIFLDLQKAFDCFRTKILDELENYSFRESLFIK